MPTFDPSHSTPRNDSLKAAEARRMAKPPALTPENWERLLAERDRLRTMLDVVRTLIRSGELPELFRKIAMILHPSLRPDYAGLALAERGSRERRLLAIDFSEGKAVVREERSIAGSAFHAEKPTIITSLAEAHVPPALATLLLAEGLNSACLIPLPGTGGWLGALGFGAVKANGFSPGDAELLAELAPSIGSALESVIAARRVSRLGSRSHSALSSKRPSEPRKIIGSETGLSGVLQAIELVAPTDAAVLFLGETGTGKDLLAHALHERSDRSEHNFITVNCSAIPAGLLESELFGHEKGAFTGALSARQGRFDLAHQGTLFLDEIGDLPLELQPKLLRVLQENEFERLGSAFTRRVDVRIVAATNRDLGEMVREGRFRSDLFYRLNVVPLRIPPLRERPYDIAPLAQHFTSKYAARFRRPITAISPAALEALARWHWPGNVRELENLIARSVALSTGSLLELASEELSGFDGAVIQNRLKHAENELIRRALRDAHGVIGGPSGAAARLGLKRSTLQSRLKKLT